MLRSSINDCLWFLYQETTRCAPLRCTRAVIYWRKVRLILVSYYFKLVENCFHTRNERMTMRWQLAKYYMTIKQSKFFCFLFSFVLFSHFIVCLLVYRIFVICTLYYIFKLFSLKQSVEYMYIYIYIYLFC